jgi:hypothetical protein
MDRRPGCLDPLAVRAAGEIGIQAAIVMDHDHAVARHAHVELERVDADRERALETRQRVFGRMAARAAMALEVERCGVLRK